MSEKSLAGAAPFRISGHRVDPSVLRASIDGEEARLEAKTMQMLVYLAEHAGQVVSRAELEDKLWPGRIVTEDSVTNAIAKLRRVFRDDARHPRVIETVPKSGYRLIAEVMPIDETKNRTGESPIPATSAGPGRKRPPGRIWKTVAITAPLLLIAAWAVWEWDQGPPKRARPLAEKPAIAVLPFENVGAAPEQDYFTNGVTADLITDLSKLQGLLVIAPGSVFAYKESMAGARQISRELDVDYVVTGSVQHLGERLRINVQLIEASLERALWGERYTGLIANVFEIQDQLAMELIEALKVRISPSEQAFLANRPTANVVAYDHYLRGLEDHGHRSAADNLSARIQFQKAIELDPTFARAYAGLALTHSREAIDGWTSAPTQSLELAATLAEQAARMDPTLPQVHFVTGQVDLFRGRHAQAIKAAERAIEVDPNYADAYALQAWILNYAGRPGEALSALKRAIRLNPRPPASYLEILGEIQFTQRKHGESASTFQRVLNINPNYARARMWNAANLALLGKRDNAEWEAAELVVLSPDFALSRLKRSFPFKDPRVLERLLEGLRETGLPE